MIGKLLAQLVRYAEGAPRASRLWLAHSLRSELKSFPLLASSQWLLHFTFNHYCLLNRKCDQIDRKCDLWHRKCDFTALFPVLKKKKNQISVLHCGLLYLHTVVSIVSYNHQWTASFNFLAFMLLLSFLRFLTCFVYLVQDFHLRRGNLLLAGAQEEEI